MRRREYLGAAGGVALGTVLAGCLGGDGSTGTLATRVTDQPGDIGDFESCVVTITEIRVKPAGGADDDDDDDGDEETPTATNDTATNATETEATTDEETAGDDGGGDDQGVERHDVDDAEADLVELQDGETELVAELELETGDYQFLQLLVSEVDAALEGGGEAEVTTPGNAPLKFNQSFEIRADSTTVFTADFTPVKRGPTGYNLKPVADGTEVSYE
jgi:hypothetical protein